MIGHNPARSCSLESTLLNLFCTLVTESVIQLLMTFYFDIGPAVYSRTGPTVCSGPAVSH